MKKVKIILGILIIICVSLLLNYEFHKEYKLDLPNVNKVVSINLIQNKNGILISKEEDINSIFDTINKITKKTIIKGDGSNITNLDNDIKIEFNYEDKLAKVVYLYYLDDKYYLEQYTNGIYTINKDVYEKIAEYLK